MCYVLLPACHCDCTRYYMRNVFNIFLYIFLLTNNVLCSFFFFFISFIYNWMNRYHLILAETQREKKNKKTECEIKMYWDMIDYSRKWLLILHKTKNGSQSLRLNTHRAAFQNMIILIIYSNICLLMPLMLPFSDLHPACKDS